jgi:hypothetical protein
MGQLRQLLHSVREGVPEAHLAQDQSSVRRSGGASAEIVFGRNPMPQIEDAVDARKLLEKFAD